MTGRPATQDEAAERLAGPDALGLRMADRALERAWGERAGRSRRRWRPMIVVGLDSAQLAGFAVVEGGPTGPERLVRVGRARIAGAADVRTLVDDLAALHPDLVVVEAAFVRHNPATTLAVATLFGRWPTECRPLGFATEQVLASTWQLGLLEGLITHRSDRAARKEAAKRWTRLMFRAELSEDEADACCLATWSRRQRRVRSRSGAPSARWEVA